MVCQGENLSQVTGSNWRAISDLGGEYLESDRKLNFYQQMNEDIIPLFLWVLN
ncbi:hypothetical protein HUN01_15825 [Nostoc edaphicum CCNP1411]|uniref:Uncharacterized protein n=1 Tax=Nostoc edaphicum CCNP1411 TaxID=1472755 RepID=A0A7D7QDP3_9NOSO|nr:hypothetical protein [Nostoc edaphicum]QMS88999.1 hypothetical protein HUN01_15825 [Nostoc edaphicum CCNP1411]